MSDEETIENAQSNNPVNMSIEPSISALNKRLVNLSENATPEELAYLGRALEAFGGRVSIMDVQALGDQQNLRLQDTGDEQRRLIDEEGAKQIGLLADERPFLRMGSYGGWVNHTVYPKNTWNALQCFGNVIMNRGGFTVQSATRVIIPRDGLYHLHCSAYAHQYDYHHTQIRVNDSATIQGGNTHTYWNGNGNGYFQHEWHDCVYLKQDDYVEFWFYQKNSTHNDHMIYHGHMHGSILYIGV